MLLCIDLLYKIKYIFKRISVILNIFKPILISEIFIIFCIILLSLSMLTINFNIYFSFSNIYLFLFYIFQYLYRIFKYLKLLNLFSNKNFIVTKPKIIVIIFFLGIYQFAYFKCVNFSKKKNCLKLFNLFMNFICQ